MYFQFEKSLFTRANLEDGSNKRDATVNVVVQKNGRMKANKVPPTLIKEVGELPFNCVLLALFNLGISSFPPPSSPPSHAPYTCVSTLPPEKQVSCALPKVPVRHAQIQRSAEVLVRGLVKFVPALA